MNRIMDENNISADLLCRVCVAPHFGEKVDLCTVPSLLEIYAWLSSSQVGDDDPYPKQICASCYHRLEEINRFRTLCIESLHSLKKRFNPNYFVSKDGEAYEITFKDSKLNENYSLTDVDNSFDNYLRHSFDNSYNPIDNLQSSFEGNSFIDTSAGCYDAHQNDYSNSEVNNANDEADIDIKPDIECSDPTVFKQMMENFNGCSSQKETLDMRNNFKFSSANKNQFLEKCLNDSWRIKENASINDIRDMMFERRGGYTYECPKCPRKFTVKERFDGHMRQHQGLKPFVCKKCHKKYSRLERLKNHMLNDHSERNMRFCCPIPVCTKAYKNRETLKRHIRWHTLDPHVVTADEATTCRYCEKNFSTIREVQEHQLEHGNTLPYTCTRCMYTFSLYRMLHMYEFRARSSSEPKCRICSL